MALSAKLQLRQSQSLVMTPQLMQSIRLLQLTHVELEQFIEQEIERNPLLERVDDSAPVRGDGHEEIRPESDDDAETDLSEFIGDDATDDARGSVRNELDAPAGSDHDDERIGSDPVSPALQDNWRSSSPGALNEPGASVDLEELTAAPATLSDHIGEQISFAGFSVSDRLIAHALAEWIDEAGYMRGEIEEIAERLNADPAAVENVLIKCQEFDPAGLFARDLPECLALQCARKNRLDPAMESMIGNLELVAKRDFVTLRKLCGVDQTDLLDMVAEIRNLDPRPGSVFTTGTADIVVPDVSVRSSSDGSWIVELNPDTLPRVLVDQAYYTEVSRSAKENDKAFLTECLQNAHWLTRSLDQRAKTILKVASEIVKQQDAFFLHGIQHLRPLNLKTVADAIEMHESTVSRVTSNKYMSTPRGVFELKYFFTAAIQSTEDGESHSSEAVRDRIREMIDRETHDKILSDDAIVDALKSSGIDIARRTVAKYRDVMNIPSSVQRRREKRAMAAAGN